MVYSLEILLNQILLIKILVDFQTRVKMGYDEKYPPMVDYMSLAYPYNKNSAL
jgi:hypothetical protein